MSSSMDRKEELAYLDILSEQLKDPTGASYVSVYVVAAYAERVQRYIQELLETETNK